VREGLYRLAALAIAVASILLACGCGGGSATTRPGVAVAPITERDFHISAPRRLPAGEVVLTVRNKGPDDHELLVVKQGDTEPPVRADGLTVDEDGLGASLVDALEPGEPGVRRLRVKLEPGRYEFLCNMAGHYLSGMEAEVVVQ
jgi:plastocyanin